MTNDEGQPMSDSTEYDRLIERLYEEGDASVLDLILNLPEGDDRSLTGALQALVSRRVRTMLGGEEDRRDAA